MMKSSWAMVIPGFVFALGLGISGMTDPGKVVGFLNLAGGWDPSLAFVMVGAIGSFAVLNVLVNRRADSILGGRMPGPRAKGALDAKLIVGAVLFGVGWGVGGICPGPALANLARLVPEMGVFVATMAVGAVVAQRVFGADA
jgi:uncharacterized membrane protein YedE/YeeE